jgi:hypothetical protein
VNNLSAALREHQANALLCIARDRDTEDGGKKGQLTSNPSDIDWVVRRAWKKIYDGIGGCIDTAVEHYFDKYSKYILKAVPFEVAELDGERVYQAFSKAAKSAGAMDGWSPGELALLCKSVCCHVTSPTY